MEVSIYFALCFLCSVSTAQILDSDKLELIDHAVNSIFLPTNHVPGMTLAIVQNGSISLSKGYGKRDIEKDLDVGNDTLFSIGSITKSFVSTIAVKTLHEKFPEMGENVLDIPIIKLRPDLNFTLSDRYRTQETTFRDILSHRTCISSYGSELLFGTRESSEKVAYRTRYHAMNKCRHRAGFVYNNSLYALAGELLAKIAGKTLEDLIKSFMLEIGMESAAIFDSARSYLNLSNMAQAYYRKDGETLKLNMKLLSRVETFLAAGGILATSTDMGKYMNFHLNKGKVGDKQVVPAAALSWLYKIAVPVTALPGKRSEKDKVNGIYAYGLGFLLGLYDGYATVSHNGFWNPFMSEMSLYPAKNIGIFISTNGPGFLAPAPNYDQRALASAIFDILLGSTTKPAAMNKTEIPEPSTNRSTSFLQDMAVKAYSMAQNTSEPDSAVKYEDVIGIYGEASTGELNITLDTEDSQYLQLNIGEWGIGRLHKLNYSERIFLVDWKTDIIQHYYTIPKIIVPEILISHVDFVNNSNINFLSGGQVYATFVRNATLDTFPEIPWDKQSCETNG